MANLYTGTGQMAQLVQAAFDRLAEFPLRAQPLHREIADKRPAQQNMPGSSVAFPLYSDLAAVSTSLSETVDPDAVAISNPSTVTVSPLEYGLAVLRTRLLNMFSFTDVDPAIANMVAFNMVDSLDTLVLNVLIGGTNVVREAGGAITINSGANSAITSTDTFQTRDVRAAVAKLRGNKAIPKKGNLFWAAIHPDVSFDLMGESGAVNGWNAPQVYSGPGAVWAGEIGEYRGAFFVETPRAFQDTTGSGSTRVFYTLVAGQQALAEAVAEEPHIVVGPVTDKLMRARPIGWYGVLNWAIYRQQALYQIRTTSSIHNT